MKSASDSHPPHDIAGLKIIFRSLRYRNYRLFFSGQSLSLVGTWIQRIALPWLVYRLTGSPFLLGVVGFAGQIPTFIFAPFSGVFTDRWNRYYILIATQILSMIQAFVLTILFLTKSIEVWHIIALSVVMGCINAFDIPARQSFVVEMVEKNEDLGNAIALNSTLVNTARLLGPSIAGLLIASVGEGTCFLINGVSYLFVITSLLLMKVKPRKIRPRPQKVFSQFKEGFSYTFGFAPIRAIILLLALISLTGRPYIVLMPVFAKKVLHGGSHTYGFLMAASGVGALLGALYLASRRSVLGLGKFIPLSACVFGIGLVVFSFSKIFMLSFFLMIVTGVGMMIQMSASNIILQTIVDDDKRGRVMSFFTMAFMGAMPFGSFLGGSAASIIGAPMTVMIGGILCVSGSLFFMKKLSVLRKMVRPIYVRLGILQEVAEGIQTATEATVSQIKN